MLFLNSENILSFVDYPKIVTSIENALDIYEKNEYAMPDRFNYTNGDKILLYMPCFAGNMFGTKILSVFPENSKFNHPVIDGLMLLNDYNTGEPKAILDGKILTALRTGAVGGVGVKHLSNENASSLGLIGSGTQGFYQIIYACSLRNIKNVYLSSKTKSKLQIFIKNISHVLPEVNFHICDSNDSVIEKSEIVIFATSSFEPVISGKMESYRGKTFIAIGSFKPNMRELNDELIKACDSIYVDTEFAKEESGDLHIPLTKGLISEDIIKPISSVICGCSSKNDGSETILYKSVGMALFDLIVSKEIYESAIKKNIGSNLEL